MAPEAPLQKRSSAWSILLLVLGGAVVGVGVPAFILWDRLAELGLKF